MQMMLEEDIWCGEVKTHLEAVADPQVEHLGLIHNYDHPLAGSVKCIGSSVTMSETPPDIHRPAPLEVQNTREVLLKFGFADE
ncbi:CoA transferase [Vibrio penaeicida]|uniref:CoA transferase n=1 Tax=Vibrio penaeicida TaxID=104609 RepID=UPI000CEA09C0|nr:CoA transferase [Vibrio penaeicida]